jgi:hypothetical protein
VINGAACCETHLDTAMGEATAALNAATGWRIIPDHDLAPCREAGRHLVTQRHNEAACPMREPPQEPRDDDLPVLPYGAGPEATAGWSGSDTSRERAENERDDGTVTRRQSQALRALGEAGRRGLTFRELGLQQGWHHGQSSGVLSALHKERRISRLTIRRSRCLVYVLNEHVEDRPTSEHKSNARHQAITDAHGEAMLALVRLTEYADRISRAVLTASCPEHIVDWLDDPECSWCTAIRLARAYEESVPR